MDYDDVAWEESERIRDEFMDRLRDKTTLMEIAKFIASKNKGGVPVKVYPPVMGAFNASIVLDFAAGPSSLMRFPLPGCSMFPEEKTLVEVATMEYLRYHTTLKIPIILYHGSRKDSPFQLGPFIIMEYVSNSGSMARAVGQLTSKGNRFELDPEVDEKKLYSAYSQMANILLQIAKIELPTIGSLVDRGSEDWEVASRPITYNMNEVVQLGSCPRSTLPLDVFDNSSSFFERLAKLHCDHFEHQQNDAITSEEDGRQKYARRQAFHKLIEERSHAASSGPFKLWCDDLRPSNVLVNDEMSIVAVIDWEFTYAAPTEYTNASPWWLLVTDPESYGKGLDAWAQEYDRRLPLFLKALREHEDLEIAKGTLRKDQILSDAMEESWKTGDFWISYAARRGFAFDTVYDKIARRVSESQRRLTSKQEEDMQRLISKKMQESSSRILKWEPHEAA